MTSHGTENNTPYALDVKVPLTGGHSICAGCVCWLKKYRGWGVVVSNPYGGTPLQLRCYPEKNTFVGYVTLLKPPKPPNPLFGFQKYVVF